MVSGRVVAVEEITGVLIRWPGVFEPELVKIAPADRGYVAREMMAFLVSWLSRLKCPVINQPTPVNLTGPAWRLEQWTYVAAGLGIPVRTAKRHVCYKLAGDQQTLNPGTGIVTVVGERCFGDVEAPPTRAILQTGKGSERLAAKCRFQWLDGGFIFPWRRSHAKSFR